MKLQAMPTGHRCAFRVLSFLLLGPVLLSRVAPAQDFTDGGWITSWLLLGPYANPRGNSPGPAMRLDYLTDGQAIFEWNFFPEEGGEVDSDCAASGIAPCYMNPDTTLTVPRVELVDVNSVNPTLGSSAISTVDGGNGGSTEADSVNLNLYWGGGDGLCPDNAEVLNNAMGYAFTYVNNTTGRDLRVIGQTASDDSIQVIIGTQTVHANNIGRWLDPSGSIQDQFEGVLRKGLNRVVVKVFDGCGAWAFRLRFLNAETCEVLREPAIAIERVPPPSAQESILVVR